MVIKPEITTENKRTQEVIVWQDFSEEKIRQAGIDCRFSNMDGAGGYSEIEKYLRSVL